MEINAIPEAFQTKLRLMIVSSLVTGQKTFSELKDITKATDGNLSIQISNLEKSGYLEIQKTFVGKKPQTTCKLTEIGISDFQEYVAMLEEILTNKSN